MSWEDESATLNAAVLRDFGFQATHTPAGSLMSTAVRVARTDPSELSAVAAAMTIFGDFAQSGFLQPPVKGDSFTVGAVVYRVFDVQGPDTSGAYYIHLSK